MMMRFQASNFCFPTLAALALTAGVMLSGGPARADTFDHLKGNWSGGGNITLANGEKERIRCRASYTPAGTNVKITLRCASDSYKFELSSDITSDGGKLSGSWSEATRQVAGGITGTATPNSIQATAMGPLFTAILNVKTSGGNQTVSITSPGSEIQNVTIALKR
jgi:hypothetical protein